MEQNGELNCILNDPGIDWTCDPKSLKYKKMYESNDKLNPTRIKGIQTIDDNKDDDVMKSTKLKTRKDIKEAMLSIRSLAITGEIED